MELTDSAVDGFFYLAEHVGTRCPDCSCFLTVDPDSGVALCPKCGWIEPETTRKGTGR